ncbi:hypothetical protein KEF29_25140 [Streptomyces tuirus]|uniref:Uncharacterized protein n=1 Tax=Streptomyces tuirus TaxID=68278 RepID=A0A941FBX3_9ACTN|nr:hypothetical protein [Streptomyces tuirus]
MDKKPAPGTLSAGRRSHLDEALEIFEAELNPGDPVHRRAGQLANLAVQLMGEYADLLAEADEHLPPAERPRVVPAHRERALEGLSRLAEILDIELEGAD